MTSKASQRLAELLNPKIPASEALSEAEWDFRELICDDPSAEQGHELDAAILYEYGRESESIREMAAEYTAPANYGIEKEGTLKYPECGIPAFLTAVPFWNCILWRPYFPETPWLRIPGEERRRRVQVYLTDAQKPWLRIIRKDDLAKWELRMRKGLTFVDRKEIVSVFIDWAAGNNSEIVSAFGDWVRKSRPEDIPEPRGDASRRNVKAAFLKRLAVMRLLHHYPFTRALILAERRELTMPQRQSNALRMRQDVATDLRTVFAADLFAREQEFIMPLDELPRSWNTLSEQRRCSRGR
jgi:hypothetical protein